MIKALHIKNFRSFPNYETTIRFSEGINLIEGKNGSGKSTIANALLWGIWGKCNYKKGDIPNLSTKGECWVKVDIETSSKDELIIERTMKSLNVTYKGDKLSFPSLAAANSFISKQLGMRYNVASFILLFSGDSCLTNMAPSKRKDIVDIIMGVDIITAVNGKAKDYMTSAKNDIASISNIIKGCQNALDNTNNIVECCNGEGYDNRDDIYAYIKDMESRLASINKELESVKDRREAIQRDMKELGEEAAVLQSKRDDIIYRASTIKSSQTCPMCSQDISAVLKESIIDKYKGEYDDIEKKWVEKKNEYDEMQKLAASVKSSYDALSKDMMSISDDISQSKAKISVISHNLVIKEKASSTIYNIESQIKELEMERDESSRRFGIVSNIYDKTRKDAECVMSVIGRHLDIISQHASNIIGSKIRFNPDYTITATDRDLDISIMSSGEQKKIDFAIKLALLDIFMTSSSEIDVCFVDECLSNVDVYAIQDIVKMLRRYTHHRHIGMYIVHHAQMDDTLFDNVLSVSKSTGYSQIEYTQNYIV